VTRDRLFLEHIGHCIARVEEYISDGREVFMSSQLIQDAVVRNLQTLAESTQRISQQLKTDHPSIDWRNISGFRNVVVHNYLGIDANQIWEIVVHDLPELKEQVELILRDLGETPT